jgi:hypothetical protein
MTRGQDVLHPVGSRAVQHREDEAVFRAEGQNGRLILEGNEGG